MMMEASLEQAEGDHGSETAAETRPLGRFYTEYNDLLCGTQKQSSIVKDSKK